jgi:serine/threonine-protein kinase HipA
MKRREAILARAQNRKEERLTESDYLLGVHDEQRMGALRFRDEEEGAFLSNESSMAAPPWTSLRELEHASWKVQDRESSSDERSLEWLNLLMAPGSSLGGARPKAGVRDPAGDLWIAKFPGRNDERDMGGWEWVVWQLAKAAGVRVAEAQLLPFGKTHRTFATCRFDRIRGSKGGKRIHFASAMTLLGYNDGTDHAVGASYLELAEFISNHGSDVQNDLRELWRRIVFSICVRNTDDHLRNHGFLLTNHGWELSPAYDLNPDPLGHGLNLNISESDNSLSFDLALEVAPYFRLDSKEAERLIDEVRAAVSSWKSIAGEAGLPRQEQEDMNRAFSLASRE